MRAPVLIGIVVGMHVCVMGSLLMMQGGCTSPRSPAVQPPPAPVMPSTPEILSPPKPVFQPPIPVEPAPSMIEPSAGKIYYVQKGDVLSKIAVRYGVSSREIMELNKIKDANKVLVGQKLVLPDYAQNVPPTVAPAVVHKPASKETKATTVREVIGAGSVYVVQAGDSLSRIASKHRTTVADLRETNNLKSEKILVGQKLTIPGNKPRSDPAKTKAASKSADKASSATADAEPPASDASAGDLMAPPPAAPAPAAPAPEAESPPALEPAAPAAAQPVLSSQDQPMDYTVQDGDTLDGIAKLFIVSKADIVKLNKLSSSGAVKPGQKIKIPMSSP